MEEQQQITIAKLLAQRLKILMEEHEIPKIEYAIIAGYGLKDYREISDLDVILSKSAYTKLKRNRKNNGIKIGSAGISKDEKLYLNVPEIDALNLKSIVEIEFFEREQTGFPSEEFSLRNLQKNGGLIEDEYENPYLSLETLVKYYTVHQDNKGKLWNGDYEINKERLEKNLSHLKLLYQNLPNINDLKSIIDKMEKY